MKQELIAFLKEREHELCDTWKQRLSENAVLAGRRITDGRSNPLHPLLADFVRVLEGKLPSAQQSPGVELVQRLGAARALHVSLSECVEVFLTGEVVIRRWARGHLDATDAEFLELYEVLSRTTHQLLRFYSLRYCESCRVRMNEEMAH